MRHVVENLQRLIAEVAVVFVGANKSFKPREPVDLHVLEVPFAVERFEVVFIEEALTACFCAPCFAHRICVCVGK